MTQTAKIFMNGRSQAVRLPAEFRFDGKEVYIRRDPDSGDVILSQKEEGWEEFIKLRDEVKVPDDFPYKKGPMDHVHSSDPFEDWEE